MDIRKIIHVDMDAFYAAVEVLDNPSLKGRPVIVGGSPESRSVVCSASYEARKFGIQSAMPCSLAKRLCPNALFVRPNFARYKEISGRIHEIFKRYTVHIETISLDEAWLDVTVNLKNIPSATRIAQRIKEQIRDELKLTCSAGVSYNKFLSKITSDEKKPDGLFVITPDEAPEFLNSLEVGKVSGVGKVTQKKLETLGIKFGSQLQEKNEEFLVKHFGKMGRHLFHIIRGKDPRPVCSHRVRKSMSLENTFETDLLYGERILEELKTLVHALRDKLLKQSLQGRTVTLKVKFEDFQQITRSISCYEPFTTCEDIFGHCREKLTNICNFEFRGKGIRLLGVGVSNFITNDQEYVQLDFCHLLRQPSPVYGSGLPWYNNCLYLNRFLA
ncbi:MAG: DNA polymerase IV [Candidatus Scalindua sp.]|nr:DNA polymerase IV [Candidatus Scalindua sp.]